MLLVMVVLVAANVVIRYSGGRPLAWISDTIPLVMVWLAFLGIGAATRQNRHIGIDILPGRVLRWGGESLLLVVDAVSLAVFVAAGCLAIQFLRMGSIKDFQVLQISYDWMYLAVPVGFFLSALHVVVRMVGRVRHLSRNAGEQSGDSGN
jgi:TRAP-type C4-dicarboxylate transport system permease small subunit